MIFQNSDFFFFTIISNMDYWKSSHCTLFEIFDHIKAYYPTLSKWGWPPPPPEPGKGSLLGLIHPNKNIQGFFLEKNDRNMAGMRHKRKCVLFQHSYGNAKNSLKTNNFPFWQLSYCFLIHITNSYATLFLKENIVL